MSFCCKSDASGRVEQETHALKKNTFAHLRNTAIDNDSARIYRSGYSTLSCSSQRQLTDEYFIENTSYIFAFYC